MTANEQAITFQEAVFSNGIVVTHNGKQGKNLRLGHYRQNFSETIEVSDVRDHTLVFQLAGTSPVRRIYGGKLDHELKQLRTTTLIPAVRGSGWQCDEEVDVLHIYLDDDVLRKYVNDTLDIDPASFELIDIMGRADKFITTLAPMLMHQVHSNEAVNQLMFDGFEQLIAGHLIAEYSSLNPPKTRVVIRRLDPIILGKVMKVMRDRMDESLGLDDLAPIAGMSTFEFAKAFKETTGQTPHQTLIAERMSRATSLLASLQLSLAEVAYECGFASQAHMTSTFTKQLGVSPGVYRKNLTE